MNPLRALSLIAALSLFLPGAARAGDVPTRGAVVNIVKWDGGELPPVYERSSQLPLTRNDILNLSHNGFAPEAIVRMVRERRFVGNASADALIELRKAGVAPEVVQAVSLHALPPNRALRLTVQLDFEGASREARQRYLYILIPDGPHERIFTADLGTVLAGRWHNDTMVDQTDPVLPRQIRRITFADSIPLKTYGEKTIRVFLSARPDIETSADIPEADRPGVREYRIDYPESSLLQECRLRVRFKQDPVLPYKWKMTGSHIECEWN